MSSETPTCPRCGSDAVGEQAESKLCRDCGRQWSEKQVAALRQRLATVTRERDALANGLKRFLNPEDMGLAVSPWVRDTIREILGREAVERNL